MPTKVPKINSTNAPLAAYVHGADNDKVCSIAKKLKVRAIKLIAKQDSNNKAKAMSKACGSLLLLVLLFIKLP